MVADLSHNHADVSREYAMTTAPTHVAPPAAQPVAPAHDHVRADDDYVPCVFLLAMAAACAACLVLGPSVLVAAAGAAIGGLAGLLFAGTCE
jgi:hypothetical protein